MRNKLNSQNFSEIYSTQRQKEDKETVWVYYVTRKISFWITPFFLKLGISANQASFITIITGIVAAILIMIGDYWIVLAGAILMQFWLILDSIDGNIARYRKTFTSFGKFLEELDGTIMSALFFSSIGVAASGIPGFIPFSIDIPSYWFIILGIITSFSVIFRHLISRHFEAIFFQNKEFRNESLFELGFLPNFYRSAIKFLGIYSLAQPLLILAVIFNFLGLYTIVYFLMNIVGMFVNITLIILKAKKE